ncbi:MAG: sigma-70 family RNA polymerase sigma factor [Eubacteriales bacterium]|nr:sigma-70 family RNA polymerase sigma factor [Eubacteriales bacterium]MDD3881229.1 sigma-70 family RNA polymerase sigma factor [Eubacteriales bacterium]MDD4512147.1 sigma-70 family RNA polymerase sigma factor [Eubacteriales bacterium]
MAPIYLLLLAQNESEREFIESAYVEYHRLMYYQAYLVTHSPEDAEDAVGNALVSLMKKCETLMHFEPIKLRAYFTLAAKHSAISLMRKRQVRQKRSTDFPAEDIGDSGEIDSELLEREGIERIAELIDRLPRKSREVMLMKYFREMTDREIAESLSLSEVSVRSALCRARKTLRDMLSRESAV